MQQRAEGKVGPADGSRRAGRAAGGRREADGGSEARSQRGDRPDDTGGGGAWSERGAGQTAGQTAVSRSSQLRATR